MALSLPLACSSGSTTPTAAPTPHPDDAAAAQLLNGLNNQLDALRDQLAQTRDNLGNPSTSPSRAPGTVIPPQTQPGASAGPGTPGTGPTPANPGSSTGVGPTGHACRSGGPDGDGDGLSDACEQKLSEDFAPVIYHSSNETHFPLTVDSYLSQSVLWFRDTTCKPDLSQSILTAPTQALLAAQEVPGSCTTNLPAKSGQTRSKDKQRTFYLANLPEEAQVGSSNPADWVTYVHVYPNSSQGATVQYWRLYAHHSSFANSRGGDWEGIHVVLDSQLKPIRVALVDNDALRYTVWTQLDVENGRPRFYSTAGTHQLYTQAKDVKASGCSGIGGFFSCQIDPEQPETHIRQETWTGGQVSGMSDFSGPSGGLVNVGERSKPLNGQHFIQYSGLWGSPGGTFSSTGAWGPAYHGAEIQANGFLTAWAAGMQPPKREEAYPLSVSP